MKFKSIRNLRLSVIRKLLKQEFHLKEIIKENANMSGANMSGANMRNAVGLYLSCPEFGDFIGWKKCLNNIIVKVKIPAKAKRSSATGRKCRAEYIKVIELFGGEIGISKHDGKTEYKKGAIVKCDKWEENRFIECGGGIHFFITRKEAEEY